MTIWFTGIGLNHGDAVVTITIEDLPVLKFEVELYGIPENPKVGHEVTVNFHADIANEGVFYTDSNGLEMQKRVLNYRPSFDIDILTGGLNVTANYYPIQTAIAIEEGPMRFVVMNDRSQGGSVIKDGRIELMQNRRLNVDDSRGMGEPLNEHNMAGVGISVPATYYVQLFNTTVRDPLQRVIQQKLDQPMQQFFTFNPFEDRPKYSSTLVSQGWDSLLKECGFTSEMKLELFTMGRNSILMRVENIADIFDNNGEVVFQQVKIQALAEGLYNLVNPTISSFEAKVEELSLTGNQSYETMREKKIKWLTVDDGKVIRKTRDSADSADTIELQQQRIRVFSVDYSTEIAEFLQ